MTECFTVAHNNWLEYTKNYQRFPFLIILFQSIYHTGFYNSKVSPGENIAVNYTIRIKWTHKRTRCHWMNRYKGGRDKNKINMAIWIHGHFNNRGWFHLILQMFNHIKKHYIVGFLSCSTAEYSLTQCNLKCSFILFFTRILQPLLFSDFNWKWNSTCHKYQFMFRQVHWQWRVGITWRSLNTCIISIEITLVLIYKIKARGTVLVQLFF
jgi:hypothetical protein